MKDEENEKKTLRTSRYVNETLYTLSRMISHSLIALAYAETRLEQNTWYGCPWRINIVPWYAGMECGKGLKLFCGNFPNTNNRILQRIYMVRLVRAQISPHIDPLAFDFQCSLLSFPYIFKLFRSMCIDVWRIVEIFSSSIEPPQNVRNIFLFSFHFFTLE